MCRCCVCILARKHLQVPGLPFPASHRLLICVNGSQYPENYLDEVFIRYSCPFRSGLDKIYFVVIYIALSFICAVAYPMLKKENHIATDNQDAERWLQLADKILFIHKGVCIIGIVMRSSFVSTCNIAQQIPTDSVFISLWSFMIMTFVDWLFLYFVYL